MAVKKPTEANNILITKSVRTEVTTEIYLTAEDIIKCVELRFGVKLDRDSTTVMGPWNNIEESSEVNNRDQLITVKCEEITVKEDKLPTPASNE